MNFLFHKMADVRNVGLFKMLAVSSDILEFGRVLTGAVYHCAKFHRDILNSCGDKTFFIFCRFGWKTPIQALFGRFLGFDPLNVERYQRNPQKAHP